jgi:hypothetical protein
MVGDSRASPPALPHAAKWTFTRFALGRPSAVSSDKGCVVLRVLLQVTTGVFALLLGAEHVCGQNLWTIPQSVARYDGPPGGPMYATRTDEVIPLSLGEMVRRAELILEGTLRVRRTYLSDDQTWIYTEFDVLPSTVFIHRRSGPAKRPGPEIIVLKQSGGRMTVSGLEVIAEESQFRLLPTGEPVFLFLSDDDRDSVYEVVGGAGAIVARDSQMRPWLKTAPPLQTPDRAGLIGDINRGLRRTPR